MSYHQYDITLWLNALTFWMRMHPYTYLCLPACLSVPVSLYKYNVNVHPLRPLSYWFLAVTAAQEVHLKLRSYPQFDLSSREMEYNLISFNGRRPIYSCECKTTQQDEIWEMTSFCHSPTQPQFVSETVVVDQVLTNCHKVMTQILINICRQMGWLSVSVLTWTTTHPTPDNLGGSYFFQDLARSC